MAWKTYHPRGSQRVVNSGEDVLLSKYKVSFGNVRPGERVRIEYDTEAQMIRFKPDKDMRNSVAISERKGNYYLSCPALMRDSKLPLGRYTLAGQPLTFKYEGAK